MMINKLKNMKEITLSLLIGISTSVMSQPIDEAARFYDRIIQNDKQIIYELYSLAENKNPQALATLGIINEYGIAIPKNEENALNYYQQLCKLAGRYDCKVRYNYEDGSPFIKNKQQLAQIFDNIKTDEVNKLYDLFEQGDQQARAMINLLADRHSPHALAMLGFIYEYGVATPKNIPEAIRYYQQACELGGDYGCRNLWYFYQYGVGVTQNKSQAEQVINKTNQSGIKDGNKVIFEKWANAIYDLKAETEIKPSLRSNFIEYIAKYLHSADDETKLAFSRMGFGTQDLLRLTRLWAKEGDAELNMLVGRFYNFRFSYLNDNDNDIQAFKWLRRAAENGNSHAQEILGDTYLSGGMGVRRDPQLAIHWYERAAEQGHAGALVGLGEIYYSGQIAPVDYEKAFSLFQQANESDSRLAPKYLSWMYYNGQFVDVDCEKAYNYNRSFHQRNGNESLKENPVKKRNYISACQNDQKIRQRAGQSLPTLTLKNEGVFYEGMNSSASCEPYFAISTSAISEIVNLRITIKLMGDGNVTQEHVIAFPAFGMNENNDDDGDNYNSSRVTVLISIYDRDDHAFCDSYYQIKTATAIINGKQTDLLKDNMLVIADKKGTL